MDIKATFFSQIMRSIMMFRENYRLRITIVFPVSGVTKRTYTVVTDCLHFMHSTNSGMAEQLHGDAS